MKGHLKDLFLFALALLFLPALPARADNFFEDMLKNKPRAYFGGVYSYSPVANSFGICYLQAPLNRQMVSTTYFEQAFFSDQAYWQDKDLDQLGDYAIIIGTHNTLFGREGIQPFWGFKGYNLKYWGFNLGLGLYAVDDLIAKHINLTYDFFLGKTSLQFAFMF